MNPSSQVFSHQFDVVRELSSYFGEVRVITASELFPHNQPSNVKIYTSNWNINSNILNALSFYRTLYKTTKGFRNFVIFSHMTEVQSVLAVPWSILRNIRHYLWYAHKTRSLYLRINHALLDGIITSTIGSCPIHSQKIHVIGQGIDEKLFSFKKRNALNHRSGLKTVHVGRIDPSKEIQELIDETLNSDSASEFSELRLIGAPTSAHIGYLEEIKRVNSDLILSGRLSLFGDIPRRLIPDILSDCDLFVHSFNGSLDKSLVEATMLGIPVVSSNIEYQSIFGTWTKSDIAGPYNLNQEIRSFMFLLKEDSETVNQEIERRLEIALQDHSLEKWIRRLVAILRG